MGKKNIYQRLNTHPPKKSKDKKDTHKWKLKKTGNLLSKLQKKMKNRKEQKLKIESTWKLKMTLWNIIILTLPYPKKQKKRTGWSRSPSYWLRDNGKLFSSILSLGRREIVERQKQEPKKLFTYSLSYLYIILFVREGKSGKKNWKESKSDAATTLPHACVQFKTQAEWETERVTVGPQGI